MNFTIDLSYDVIPNELEKDIINYINNNIQTTKYSKMSDDLINKIINHINSNKNYTYIIDNNMSLRDIIISINSSYIKNKMIKTYHKTLSKSSNISKDYNNKINILELSQKYDCSPLTILRIYLLSKYNKIQIKKYFNNPKLLNTYDREQFEVAKANDNYALVNQDSILEKATLFEQKIQVVLDDLNIIYKTQADLTEEQIKNNGFATSTPDFLILSNLTINNIPIKWIDAKNYYGANIKFIRSNIQEQTKKYIKLYGSGCIIFNLGFNELFIEDNILFLSYNSFIQLTK